MLRYDFRCYYATTHGGKIKRWFRTVTIPGFQALAIYRFGHWLLAQPTITKVALKPVFALLFLRMRARWGIELDPAAKIGKGLMIHHYGGIFVGGGAVIGDNVSIACDVIIGLGGRGPHHGIPVVGSNVLISPGAKLAGKIQIGNNAQIGANAVVLRDVPENGLVQLKLLPIVAMDSLYGP